MSAPVPLSLETQALRLAEAIRTARSLPDAASLALVALREATWAERDRVLGLAHSIGKGGELAEDDDEEDVHAPCCSAPESSGNTETTQRPARSVSGVRQPEGR